MKRRLMFVFFTCSALLAGCVMNAVKSHGNLTGLAAIDDKSIVEQTVDHLVRIYPPAHSRMNFAHKADRFGYFMMRAMRERGYAVQAYTKTNSDSEDGLSFSYLLDEFEVNSSRIILLRMDIGTETLSVLYQRKSGDMYPVSLWSLSTDQKKFVGRELPLYAPEVIESNDPEEVRVSTANYFIRMVAFNKGLILRDQNGQRIRPLGIGERIINSRLLADDEIPVLIKSNSSLSPFQWGQGEYKGQLVLFAWELTRSTETSHPADDLPLEVATYEGSDDE